MNVIEIEKLTKYYGKSRGVADISLDVRQGEIFGFIGPNGAGKSTTIRTLLGFIHPNAGKASILGMNCFKDIDKIKMEIGYVPSEVKYYDDMKVKDLLAYSAKFYKKDCSRRTEELCSIFGVETGKRIDSLSFGNKKKVSIVQALLHEPRLLLLDEPTGGLDPLMQNSFFDVLREEKNKGTTIFFSSHILSEVERMCDRVAIIKEGRILKIEQIETLKQNKRRRIKLELAEGDSFENINLAGVTDLSLKNTQAEFLFSGDINEVIKKLSERRVDNLWIEEPSLEEVFMHYYEKD